VITPVRIPGSSEYRRYTVQWQYSPKDMSPDGKYTCRAIFIASGQEVQKAFETS